jgi:hypothetical protein
MHFFDLNSEELRAILKDGLEVTRQKAYQFWFEKLNRMYGYDPSLRPQITYVAAILAKFSQTGITAGNDKLNLPEFVKLAEIRSSDALVGQAIPPKEFERAGCHFLFLCGFEEKHVFKMLGRNTAKRIGENLFMRASTDPRDFVMQMSDHFMDWQHRLAYLHYQLIKNWADLTQGVSFITLTPKV